MTLFEALAILARVHTRYDDVTGMRIEYGADPYDVGVSTGEFALAWAVVREQAGLPIVPEVK
jgi:hypothetical protein